MALHVPPLQVHLETDEQVEEQLCEKGCKVVELYAEWCGPCKSVLPTFRRIRLDKDDEATLRFLTMKAEACEFLEIAKERRGQAEPYFLVFRNGALKHKVEGSNTPVLSKVIMELTPTSADVDDLEENPLFLARKERQKEAARAAKEAEREKNKSVKKKR